MRINKGLFSGVLIGFAAAFCFQGGEVAVGESRSAMSPVIPVVEFMQTDETSIFGDKVDPFDVKPELFRPLMPEPEKKSQAMPSSISKSEALRLLSESVSADIAAGNYKKPYEYLRNRRAFSRGFDNGLKFSWRNTRFTDGTRREFLNVYLEQLHEAGYDDWIGKIRIREREDYYNATLARLRYLYVMLERLRQLGRDDILFSRLWCEFDFLGRRLDDLQGIANEFYRYKDLGLSEETISSIPSMTVILPVPEVLPAEGEKMTF